MAMGKTTKLVRYTGKEGKSTRTRGPSGPRPPRQTLREEDRFTGASLQKLMQDHVIKAPYEDAKRLTSLTQAGATAGNPNPNTNAPIQGTFTVTPERHARNFRQPDWASWCTTFDAVTPGAGAG
jgi:hypothetical protein